VIHLRSGEVGWGMAEYPFIMFTVAVLAAMLI
jgi:hypothetical protein